MRSKIAFCVIVEGDTKLESLKRLINSVEKYVDGVYITANGGEEGIETKNLKKYCEEKNFNYSYLAWSDDFGLQRNYNWSQVGSEYDFILWADSDDVIVGAEFLPRIADIAVKNDHDCVFFDYWYGCLFEGEPSEENLKDIEITQKRERLFKVGKFIWKNRIHETPVTLPGMGDRYTKVPYSKQYPIAWLHLGADRNISKEVMDKRMSRNQRLLELQLNDERSNGQADPRTLLYLMKIYAELEDPNLWKECINMGEEYMSKSGWDQERALCVTTMAICYGKLNQHDKEIKLLLTAIEEYPHSNVLYLKLARAYFHAGNHRSFKHWMEIGLNMDMENNHISNILEAKIIGAELLLNNYLYVEKDAKKAYESAVMLNKLSPTEQNQTNEDMLFDLKEMDLATANMDHLTRYLDETGHGNKIPELIKCLPKSMQDLPFSVSLYNKHVDPKIWGSNEICYYASFGQNHFEKWGPSNLIKGIGGSETAVIRLAQEWTKLGYKVTVYADCGQDEGEHDGVTWLPYYKFNPRDYFNIFIQWRSSHLVKRIVAKKFLVDLHDLFNEMDHLDKIDSIDRLMVKSKFHRELAPKIKDDKFKVISNGI